MKSTGMVRPIDELGRIVLPKEIRRSFDLSPKDSVEIFTDGDKIILQKYAPACIFCGDARDVSPFKGKLVCKACMAALASEKNN